MGCYTVCIGGCLPMFWDRLWSHLQGSSNPRTAA